MRKFASLTLHKERERERERWARDPLSPTLSHGALGRVQPATVIYHRSNLPGNSSHSAERSNEFVARWIVRLLTRSSMAKVDADRTNFLSYARISQLLATRFNTCVELFRFINRVFLHSTFYSFLEKVKSGWKSRRISILLPKARRWIVIRGGNGRKFETIVRKKKIIIFSFFTSITLIC